MRRPSRRALLLLLLPRFRDLVAHPSDRQPARSGPSRQEILCHPAGSLTFVLLPLAATTIGAKAPLQVKPRRLLALLVTALPLHFGGFILLRIDADLRLLTVMYIAVTATGLHFACTSSTN